MKMIINAKIENKEGNLVVSSRVIAEQLGKEHKHVLESLDKITGVESSTDLSKLIISSTYVHSQNKQTYKEYLLTEKGFTLYMFNVQGYNEFKMAYINEFERMKNELNNKVKLPTTYKEALQELLLKVEENEKLTAKNETLTLDVKHKTKVIDDMTSGFDGVYLRTICTDYVNKVSRETGKHQSELYLLVYTQLGRLLKKDIKVAKEKYCKSQRELVAKNKIENSELGLKGEDRKFPFKISDSKAGISTIEYVCDVLGASQNLMEVMSKIFEVEISDIIEKYNIYKETGVGIIE